jgi:hypothetical protein
MNDNERKFFLRRFFSFNVPGSFNSGTSNASFNEGSELEEIEALNYDKDDLLPISSAKLNEIKIEVNDTTQNVKLNEMKLIKNLDKSTTNNNSCDYFNDREKSLSKSNENLNQNLENEKLIKDSDSDEIKKKPSYGTQNQKKSTEKKLADCKSFSKQKSNKLIHSDSVDIENFKSTENILKQISNETIKFNPLPTLIINSQDSLINLSDNIEDSNEIKQNPKYLTNRFLNDLTSLSETERKKILAQSQLQQQYSIELMPFRKKEVQIVEID